MSDSNTRSFIDSFRLHDRYSCEMAIRNGGVAAFVSAGVNGLFATAGFFINSSDTSLAYVMDPMMIIDVVLIGVLGVFVFRKSRAAATLLLAYFVVSKVPVLYQVGQVQGLTLSIFLILSMIFFFYYFTAMRATYIWHTSYRNAETAAVHAA